MKYYAEAAAIPTLQFGRGGQTGFRGKRTLRRMPRTSMTARRALLAAFGLCSLALVSALPAQISAVSPIFTHQPLPDGSDLTVAFTPTNSASDQDLDRLAAELDSTPAAAPAHLIGATRRSERLELFSDLFTRDQLATANLVSNLAQATRSGLRADPGATSASAYAGAISASLVYGSGPNVDAWPTLTSWASNQDSYRGALMRQLMPMTLDFTRRNPFYGSEGGFSNSLDWFAKAVILLPSPHGSRASRAGTNVLRYGTLEFVAGDLHRKTNAPNGDFAGFCRSWLKRTASVVASTGLSALLSPKQPSLAGLSPQLRAIRTRPEFPVSVTYSY